MKMNVPQEEAEQCVEKVRERRMGYWFENVKMDIQAERRKAEEERRKAEEACRAMEEGLAKARNEVEAAKEKADWDAQKRVEAEMKIDEVTEEMYQAIVSLAQEYSGSKEDAISKLIEKCNISKELAEEKLKAYWTE